MRAAEVSVDALMLERPQRGAGPGRPRSHPHGHEHGGPRDARRHAGDLGNVHARDGCVRAEVRVPDTAVADLAGRGVVLHARADDLGRGGTSESRETGSAGARIACAPIVR